MMFHAFGGHFHVFCENEDAGNGSVDSHEHAVVIRLADALQTRVEALVALADGLLTYKNIHSCFKFSFYLEPPPRRSPQTRVRRSFYSISQLLDVFAVLVQQPGLNGLGARIVVKAARGNWFAPETCE